MPKKSPDNEIIKKIWGVLEKNPQGLWMREIARKSGVSKSAVHSYLHAYMSQDVEEVMSVSGLVRIYRLKEGRKMREERKKEKPLSAKELILRKVDYEKLGLICGVEIHQQLNTEKKLFCSCKTTFSGIPEGGVVRKLRPVAGETGDVDIAALHERVRDKEFTYRTYHSESCLVELDSEPPHELNREALRVGLEVALILNCTIPREIHVMRKTIIDGSNTSGFQRTSLIGINGFIETSFGRVGIQNINLEEDSSQILNRQEKRTEFGLNRLGIPLIEIGTAPDIHTPEQAKEVAEKLGMILRSTGKARRGLGTIRQDLNVSIKDGARTELKGVQDLRAIPKIVENEALRQEAMVKKGKEVENEVRKVLPNAQSEFLRPLAGAARLYPETDIPQISITQELLDNVKKNLPELLGDKKARLEKEYGLGEELVKQLVQSGKGGLFEKLIKTGSDKKSIAMVLTSGLKDLKTRDNVPAEKITDEHLLELFRNLGKESASKETLLGLLKQIAENPDIDIKDLVEKTKSQSLPESEVEAQIKKMIAEKKGLSFGAYMGIAMKQFNGKVSGEVISKILKKELGE